MHSHLAARLSKSSSSSTSSHPPLSTVPPPTHSSDYSADLAQLAARILHLSPLPSKNALPIYVLNAAVFPDAKQVDYDTLLPYVLARLPDEEELIGGKGYEVIFFAGSEGGVPGGDSGIGHGSSHKRGRPGWGWFVQAYNVLTRATRKRLQTLYIVHSRAWVRLLVETFSTIVSPKFRKKIIHCSSLTSLAIHLPIENLLIPPSAYYQDRKLGVKQIDAPYAVVHRAFGVRRPFPRIEGGPEGDWRLPRVLRETSNFLLLEENVRLEGIFRIPALSILVDVLREAYDRGQKFIVWKESPRTWLPISYPKNALQPDKAVLDVQHVDPEDAYPAPLAAAVLKLWYAKLLMPLFPTSAYASLRTLSTSTNEDGLVQFLSPHSSWSTLPLLSRQILVHHLLPLLSLVSSHSATNKMSARNLATCIAPSLIRGPDQLEDANLIATLSVVLETAIKRWDQGLREACDIDADAFVRSLQSPERDEDYEDPLLDENRNISTATTPISDSIHETGPAQVYGEITAQKVGIVPGTKVSGTIHSASHGGDNISGKSHRTTFEHACDKHNQHSKGANDNKGDHYDDYWGEEEGEEEEEEEEEEAEETAPTLPPRPPRTSSTQTYSISTFKQAYPTRGSSLTSPATSPPPSSNHTTSLARPGAAAPAQAAVPEPTTAAASRPHPRESSPQIITRSPALRVHPTSTIPTSTSSSSSSSTATTGLISKHFLTPMTATPTQYTAATIPPSRRAGTPASTPAIPLTTSAVDDLSPQTTTGATLPSARKDVNQPRARPTPPAIVRRKPAPSQQPTTSDPAS